MLGLLEAKIFVAYVTLKLGFELDLEPDLQGKKGLSYSISNDNKLHVRVNRISP